MAWDAALSIAFFWIFSWICSNAFSVTFSMTAFEAALVATSTPTVIAFALMAVTAETVATCSATSGERPRALLIGADGGGAEGGVGGAAGGGVDGGVKHGTVFGQNVPNSSLRAAQVVMVPKFAMCVPQSVRSSWQLLSAAVHVGAAGSTAPVLH